MKRTDFERAISGDERKAWLSAAPYCPDRYYNGARKVWLGSGIGHPMCGWSPVSGRCMFRKCPRRPKVLELYRDQNA